MFRRSLTIIILVFYILGAGFIGRLRSQGICDPSLPRIKDGSIGYRDRGDRCEGLYINPVSSTTLFVASFTKHFENYDLNAGNALLIEWDKPRGKKEIHLRAQSIKQRLYYRMDSYRSGGNTFYAWPSGLLASLKISRKDIGVVGRTKLLVGQTERDVYLPLRIRKQDEPKPTGTYKLILMPGVQLTEIYITLASVGRDGSPEKFLRTEQSLGYGFYPADRAVEIKIETPKDKGIYYLKVGAQIRSGGTKALEFWFYNNG
ncbi:MAG: hypothetical protein WKF91_22280 [Segetibacter sp.]